jgi:hypothetical protein
VGPRRRRPKRLEPQRPERKKATSTRFRSSGNE